MTPVPLRIEDGAEFRSVLDTPSTRPTRFAAVIEPAGDNWSAYVPDLPGVVATGATEDEAAAEIRQAVAFHLEGMGEDGEPRAEPRVQVIWVVA